MIYREGFVDLPRHVADIVIVFAGHSGRRAFIWLVYGFTRAFSSTLERLISFGRDGLSGRS
jgi:hypothetical protein